MTERKGEENQNKLFSMSPNGRVTIPLILSFIWRNNYRLGFDNYYKRRKVSQRIYLQAKEKEEIKRDYDQGTE